MHNDGKTIVKVKNATRNNINNTREPRTNTIPLVDPGEVRALGQAAAQLSFMQGIFIMHFKYR